MIVGLIKPNEGQIFLEDDNGQVAELTKEPVYRRAQMGVGYLAQEASVFRRLSVEDNIKAVLEMTDLKKDEQAARCEALIEEFRLQKVRKSLGIQLSGGERRRTEIARAVAINPAFILLDEPFAGVDPIAVEDIQSIVATLKNKNIGVIITDHNVDETLAITDRTYLLFEGKILKAGSAEELAADPMVRKVYLGQHFELRRSPTLDKLRKGQPRTQPKRSRPRRSRPRRNRPCPPSAGQCPADRPRGIRLRLTTVRPRATPESGTVFRLRQTPLPAKPGTPKRSPERIADSQPIPGAYPEKKRTDNHFRTPVCIVQFARIIPASGNGKRNNDFLTRAATDVNSDLPHRKIQ